MSTNGELGGTLLDLVTTLISLDPDGSKAVDASLRTLVNKITTTPHTESTEEALQLLGTAVGKQSRHVLAVYIGLADYI